MGKTKDHRIGKRKYKIVMPPRFPFTCERCHKWGWSTIPGRTVCKDCERGKKQIEQLSDGKWLESTGHVSTHSHCEYFFLDLIDRSRPVRYDKNIEHFVWSLALEHDSGGWAVWFGGMLVTYWQSHNSAQEAIEFERRQITDDITAGLYAKWPEQCPVCLVPLVSGPAFEGYQDFQQRTCPNNCGRRWTHWIGESAEGAQ